MLFAMAALCLQAQNKYSSNSLLWKITGKNLSKPSYLYGTIHVQDKRVFNFSDSLYSFIRSADGYAMEIHPDSLVMAVLHNINESATSDYLKKYMKKDEFDRLNTRLKKDLGIDADKLSIKETYMLRQHLAKPERKADDMPTIVDAYLYGMAKNQGKEIAGLEKAGDQLKLLGELRSDDFNPTEILKSLKKEQTLIEKMIQLYVKEDLKGIGEMMSLLPDKTEDKLLILRNVLMVEKMDSLMRSKSFVVAVGTAHLPGEKGMIALLREKGYTVDPVYTTSRTHANDYAIKAQQLNEWVEVKEPQLGYTARMPGKPSPMDMLNGVMKMNLYIDMTSMKQYYTAFVLPGVSVTKSNADSILQAMYKNMVTASIGEAISDKRFVRQGFEGIDMLYKIPSENMFARVQTLAFGKRVYMVGMGARVKDDLYVKEANDYFNAFTIESIPEQQWERHTFKEHFVSVLLPEPPKPMDLQDGDTSMVAIQYNSIDKSRGNMYCLVIVATEPGFVMPDDSMYFALAAKRFTSTMNVSKLTQRDTMVQGFRAQWILAELEDQSILKYLTINRGNKVYSLIASGTPEDTASAQLAEFFKSISFSEYPSVKWKEKPLPEYGFTVKVPSDFSRIKLLSYDEDTAVSKREYMWTGFDSTTFTSFTITRRIMSPYLWAKDDTTLLKQYMGRFNEGGIKPAGHALIKVGNSRGIDFSIFKKNSIQEQRNRVLLNGTSMYILQVEAPKQFWSKYDLGQFISGFRFHKEESSDFIRTNSFSRLLTDLKSKDSATYSGAFGAINEVVFDSTDIPALLKASVDTYPLDTLKYSSVQDHMLRAVSELEHPDLEKLITDLYVSLKPDQEKSRFLLLTVLARRKTQKSYSHIAQMLGKALPKMDKDLQTFMFNIKDSLELTKQHLYPQLFTLSADTMLGVALFSLHKQLLDSNLISLDEVRTHHAVVISAAKYELSRIRKNTSKYYYAMGSTELMEMLGKLKSPEAISLLREFVKARYNNVKLTAAVELLKLKQPVDPAIFMTIAADKGYRVSLYEKLTEFKMDKAFPEKYRNQRAFAESYVDDNSDYTFDKIEFIGEKISPYKGTMKRFFLFKVTFVDYDDERVSRLAISGPFKFDPAHLLLEGYMTGLCEQNFKQSAIDEHFREYLKGWEEYSDDEGVAPPDEDN